MKAAPLGLSSLRGLSLWLAHGWRANVEARRSSELAAHQVVDHYSQIGGVSPARRLRARHASNHTPAARRLRAGHSRARHASHNPGAHASRGVAPPPSAAGAPTRNRTRGTYGGASIDPIHCR
jgi:hypothetical protein